MLISSILIATETTWLMTVLSDLTLVTDPPFATLQFTLDLCDSNRSTQSTVRNAMVRIDLGIRQAGPSVTDESSRQHKPDRRRFTPARGCLSSGFVTPAPALGQGR